ncbi:ubiquitin domain-containing protein [Cephalotus follicularis]|uniref:Ubiquitin domain-containing protein n=1 Tax=Cephalotus follicularis TaxID=3775 RepID=A0A1Q3C0V9_CEPFO|nr:ubiquitin domain-containing protein [Cephalotus follicularis]
MGSKAADKVSMCNDDGNSETTIEIKIKTLDSQTHTLRVDKQVPVPALKEQIASVTGVLSEQQRLICRGKLLKDDQLLSAYHVEDGHTLHLVVRQPIPPSSDGIHNHSETDPVSGTSPSENSQITPRVVIETINVPHQGGGVRPEIGRIVSAVLGSFGFSNMGSGSDGIDVRERLLQGVLDTTQLQPEQTGMRGQSDGPHSAFGFPASLSLGSLSPPVISDSLTTLLQYLNQMRHEFDAIGRSRGNNVQATGMNRTQGSGPDSATHTGMARGGLPTPALLAEVLLSTREMLSEQAGEHLVQLARQLEDQVNMTDPSVRSSTQSNALRTGLQLYNLGAFLLELGRTIMTVRLGQTPSEALVNAGPAVFISASGPNPLMVQPLPFQPGTGFGTIPMGTVQPVSGLVNGLGTEQTGTGLFTGIGTGFLPRRIDIQIRRGSSVATPNANRDERNDNQLPSDQRNPSTDSSGENVGNQTTSRVTEGSSFSVESGVPVLPIRTMVAAVPGPFPRLPSDSNGSSIGLYCPVLGRFQLVGSGNVSAEQGSQVSGDHDLAGVQTELQSVHESDVLQQNVENPARDGSLPTNNSRQQGPSNARTVNVNILSSGGTQNNQESEGQIPSSVFQFLRSLFPVGEIHVEDAGVHGTPTGSVPENAGTSTGPIAAESTITDEGIFLSNLLREIIPVVSQHVGAESNVTPGEAHSPENRMAQESNTQAQNSEVGTSRRPSDTEPSPSNSKRQKTE